MLHYDLPFLRLTVVGSQSTTALITNHNFSTFYAQRLATGDFAALCQRNFAVVALSSMDIDYGHRWRLHSWETPPTLQHHIFLRGFLVCLPCPIFYPRLCETITKLGSFCAGMWLWETGRRLIYRTVTSSATRTTETGYARQQCNLSTCLSL
jgi:hypothetical protein